MCCESLAAFECVIMSDTFQFSFITSVSICLFLFFCFPVCPSNFISMFWYCVLFALKMFCSFWQCFLLSSYHLPILHNYFCFCFFLSVLPSCFYHDIFFVLSFLLLYLLLSSFSWHYFLFLFFLFVFLCVIIPFIYDLRLCLFSC